MGGPESLPGITVKIFEELIVIVISVFLIIDWVVGEIMVGDAVIFFEDAKKTVRQFPDYRIENTVQDIIQGNDNLLDKALDLMKE